MGLFDFFDSRKSLARWAAKCFRLATKKNPNATDVEIIQLAIRSRYAAGPSLSDSQKKILQDHRNEAVDIHSLCHVIAEVELLNHLSYSDRRDMTMKSENIVEHTYNVISEELERLGFPKKQINKINPLEEKCPNHPEKAAKFPCAICGRFVCPDCILEDKGLTYCRNEKCREKANRCHNHPQKSSFAYCEICQQFYCEDCLTKVGEYNVGTQQYVSYVCKNEKCRQQFAELSAEFKEYERTNEILSGEIRNVTKKTFFLWPLSLLLIIVNQFIRNNVLVVAIIIILCLMLIAILKLERGVKKYYDTIYDKWSYPVQRRNTLFVNRVNMTVIGFSIYLSILEKSSWLVIPIVLLSSFIFFTVEGAFSKVHSKKE